MLGYKVFNSDWTCRDFQYKVGETFEMDSEPECCKKGFHFCLDLNDCFNYYNFNLKNKIAMVEALGDIDVLRDADDTKRCTNKIKIVKEITWFEALEMLNKGMGNTGRGNKGDYNTGSDNEGSCNSGCSNIGNFNTGSFNIGHSNVGTYNHGNRNCGTCNIGNFNCGDYNIGNQNVGAWNKTNHSSGFFNTKPDCLIMFNKPTTWTLRDWYCSKAGALLLRIPCGKFIWVEKTQMTEQEKEEHPNYLISGGCERADKDSIIKNQAWWDTLSQNEKNCVKELPNFDAAIFEEITGIKVEADGK